MLRRGTKITNEGWNCESNRVNEALQDTTIPRKQTKWTRKMQTSERSKWGIPRTSRAHYHASPERKNPDRENIQSDRHIHDVKSSAYRMSKKKHQSTKLFEKWENTDCMLTIIHQGRENSQLNWTALGNNEDIALLLRGPNLFLIHCGISTNSLCAGTFPSVSEGNGPANWTPGPKDRAQMLQSYRMVSGLLGPDL